MSTILHTFSSTVGKFPRQTAFTFIDRHFSYREYDALSNRVAHALKQYGIRPGDRVAIHLPNIPQYLVFMMGALKAGCVISGLSPLATAREVEFQLKDLGASALISFDDAYAKNVRPLLSVLGSVKIIVVTRPLDLMPFPIRFFARLLRKVPHVDIRFGDSREIWFKKFLGQGNEEALPIESKADDLAAIQYTGGTTGQSKGAMLSHRNFLSNIEQSMAVTRPEIGGETGLSILPFFHIAGLTAALNTIAIAGSWLLIPNPRDLNFIVRQLKKYRPSLIFAVPLLYERLLEREDFRRLDFTNLKYAMSGAAPMSDRLKESLEAVIRVPVLEGYGMTEAAPGITINYPGRVKPGTVGQALPGTELKVVALEDGAEPGQVGEGELIVAGPQVMQGYWNNPEETKNALRIRGEKKWLHTGDVARIDGEGYVTIVDRVKDMVNVGGYKVYSVEVESVIAAHPAVKAAAILAEKSKEYETEVVKLIVELKPEYKSQERARLNDDILGYARDRLAAYKIPRIVEFMDAIPLTPIGKVDKKTLRSMAQRR